MALSLKFRKIGGSLVFAVPKQIVNELALAPGQAGTASIEKGRIVIDPARKKARYTIEELLAECDLSAPLDPEGVDFMNMPELGREIAE